MAQKSTKQFVFRWSVFLILLAVAFFAVEIPAVIDPADGDTLSEVIWYWMDKHPIVASFISIVFFWLCVHMIFRGKIDGAIWRWFRNLFRKEES